MTLDKLIEILAQSGIQMKYYDVDEEHWDDEPDRFRCHLDYEDFGNLITMYRLTTALLAAGCTRAEIEEKETGSGNEVSHWRELVMEFPRAST